jgi:hypothetical protein
VRYTIHEALHHRADFHISAAVSLALADYKASSEQVVHYLAAHYYRGPCN